MRLDMIYFKQTVEIGAILARDLLERVNEALPREVSGDETGEDPR